jgi:hypothetical protein
MSEIISLTIAQAETLAQMMKASQAYDVAIVAQLEEGALLVGHNREYLFLAANGEVSRAKFEPVPAAG